MNRFSQKQILISFLIISFVTIVIGLLWQNLAITISGLLLNIFLSLFIGKKRITVIVSIVALIIISVLGYSYSEKNMLSYWEEIVLVLSLLFFIGFALYTKNVLIHLSEDKTHMRLLFENATEGIIIVNEKGRIVVVNPAAEKLFDYKMYELLDQPIEILVPDSLKIKHNKLRKDFVKTEQKRIMADGRELNGKKKDGTFFPVEISLSTYKQNNERFVIAFVIDICKRKEIEKSMVALTEDMKKLNTELEAKVEERTFFLQDAMKKLEKSQKGLSVALEKEKQLNEIKSRFLSMASHEFRTPLSTIFSSAMLTGKYKTENDQEKRERHINKIKDSVKHLNELLEDFLSLGKLEMNKEKVNILSFNVEEFIVDLEDEVKVLLKSGQKLVSTVTGNETFNTDNRVLKNLMINILSNAIKFSGEYKKIELEVQNKGQELLLIVRDEGVGIPEEDKQNLFTTFFRAKNVLNIEGTGLGLQIVKRYLDLLDGSIRYESKEGEGTTFYITIPFISEVGEKRKEVEEEF